MKKTSQSVNAKVIFIKNELVFRHIGLFADFVGIKKRYIFIGHKFLNVLLPIVFWAFFGSSLVVVLTIKAFCDTRVF